MTEPRQLQLDWQRWGKRIGKLILLLAPIPLLWWAFDQVPFDQVWETLQRLSVLQILFWLLLNAGLIILMSGRWWLILKVLGYPLPYLALVRYRLASFAVSYFTPGPQFGGEPVQVLALRQLHIVPGSTGTASVGLDKLLELIANFSFLVFGLAVALLGAWLPFARPSVGIATSLALLAIPLAYLILMLIGRKPLNIMIAKIPKKIQEIGVITMLRAVETEMSGFCVAYPKTVLLSTLISLSVWVGMLWEYWLLTHFLGLHLTLPETISALVAARLAFLTPLPAGLGALESSQVFALQTLGLDPSFGVSISLIIRLRDIFFGLAGLLGAASIFRARD